MKLRVVTFTFSDTRTQETDIGGKTLCDELTSAGLAPERHSIVGEELLVIRESVRVAALACDAIVTTGGTGLGPRDVTIAALEPLFDKRMDGFGEAFRRLSEADVGVRAMLSNATAGLVGTTCIFALPGSPKAIPLAVRKLIAPVLEHAVKIAQGGGHG